MVANRKIKIKLGIISLTLFIIFFFYGEIYSQFIITGELRPRTEYRHGYKSLADTTIDYALFTNQRTRFNINYNIKSVKMGISIQDVRIWGSQKQLNISDGLLSIHETWAELFLSERLSLKIGRQEVVYDDQRILGNVDWLQQGLSHDIAVLKYENKLKIHSGLAYNQDRELLTSNIYTVSGNYKTIQFIWINKSFHNLNASILFLNNGLQGLKSTSRIIQIDSVTYDTIISANYHINYSQTVGSRIAFNKNKLIANTAFYYQMGKGGTGIGEDIKAYYLQMDIGYKLTSKLSLTTGIEILSGTNQTDTVNTQNNSFTPFYGTNHKFNGHMDYFYVGNHLNSVGLQDIFLKVNYSKDTFTTVVDFHLFFSSADILNIQEYKNNGIIKSIDNYLGYEIDIAMSYMITKNVDFKIGYSQIFGTKSLIALKGGSIYEISNWAWMMFVIKPELFNSGNKLNE